MKTKITFIIVVFVISIVLTSAGNARAATWTLKADMPTPRWGHSAAVVNGKIYVIGGLTSETSFLNGKSIAAVEEYDPATDTWNRKADIPAARGYLYGSHPVVDGKIYVVGGGNGGESVVSRVDVYDPATDTWSRATDMPTPRILMARAAWNGKIYVFGGRTGSIPSTLSTVNVTEVYDPQTDTWTEAAPMPRGVWEHSANVVDDKIYVIGGAIGQNSERLLQVYDPRTDMWTNATPKPLNTRGFGATTVCGNIYAIGGWLNSGQRPYSDTWVYDPTTDTWTAGVPLPDFRAVLSTSMVNGRIYAIGGSPRQHNLQATSTVYELDMGFPTPDFNGDGIVDGADISIMVDHWHMDEPLYDIAPVPCGDGIVNVQDLIVLSEHLLPVFPAHWELDETESSVAYDSAGDYDGILNGNPLWRPTSGKIAGSLELDGVDDYVSTPFILDPAKRSLSAFAWIKGGGPGQVIVSQTDGLGYGAAWLYTDSTDEKLITKLMDPQPALISESVTTDGIWHHIGLVWDGSIRYLYMDGEEVARDAASLSYAIPCDGGLNIGVGKTLDADSFFSGLIDDVRIYNKALSPEEVEALVR